MSSNGNVQLYRRNGGTWLQEGGRFNGTPAIPEVSGLLENAYEKGEFHRALQVFTPSGEYLFIPTDKGNGGGWHNLDWNSPASVHAAGLLNKHYGELADQLLDGAIKPFPNSKRRANGVAAETGGCPVPFPAPDMS